MVESHNNSITSSDGTQPDVSTGTELLTTQENPPGDKAVLRLAPVEPSQPPQKEEKPDTRPLRTVFLHEPGRWPPGGWERDLLQVIAQQYGAVVRGKVKEEDPEYGRVYRVQGASQQLERLAKRYKTVYDQVYERARSEYKAANPNADKEPVNWAPYVNAFGAGLVQGYAQVHDISHAPQRPARHQALYEYGIAVGREMFGQVAKAKVSEDHHSERELVFA